MAFHRTHVENDERLSPTFWVHARESIPPVNLHDEPAAADVDLLVIGGGITGCAVARDAAARGLSVVPVSMKELASGTSGRSTKLLHGGLRHRREGPLWVRRQA